MPNLSRTVFAISGVGDLEAITISIPYNLRAYSMPSAWGYKEGILRLERHSLENKHMYIKHLI